MILSIRDRQELSVTRHKYNLEYRRERRVTSGTPIGAAAMRTLAVALIIPRRL